MAQNLNLNKLLPSSLKNETLTSLVSNLFNRFVSQEDSVLVEGQIGTSLIGSTSIQEPTLERQENALVPSIFYTEGTEKSLFTFKDFVDKMNVLNIDISDMREWSAEQSYNYSPPISYDKFINYNNYYWIGKYFSSSGTLGPTWNIDNNPEYYTIKQPGPNEIIKMPVKAATIRNINLWINDRPPETFTLTFTANDTFILKSTFDASVPSPVFNTIACSVTLPNSTESIPILSGSPVVISSIPNETTRILVYTFDSNTAPSIGYAGEQHPICEFYIVNGSKPFSAGDIITVELTYFTSSYVVALDSNNLIGKGTVNGVLSNGISTFMNIDGIIVYPGDRVLVKDQIDPTENGIYLVLKGSKWERAFDAREISNFQIGSLIYVNKGFANNTQTFVLTSGALDTGLFFTLDSSHPALQLNNWQLNNFWVHKDDLIEYNAIGLTVDSSSILQATCPIIEYSNKLALNKWVDGVGNPTSQDTLGAISYNQKKNKFNQIPQFDLFRYDGTHANKTSSIFFYNENPDFVVNSILQKRVETTINSDFVFGLGINDEHGRLLYFKDSGILKSIWQPGVEVSSNSSPLFFGLEQKGNLVISSLSSVADNQQWKITFTADNIAEVSGTRSGIIGTISADTGVILFEDFSLSLSTLTGKTFSKDEYFTFNVYAPLSPRYIKKDATGNIINYPKGNFESGYAADMSTIEPSGAWLTPLRMFQNLKRETYTTIAFADFINHGRSVLRLQDGFTGSSFGVNNSRSISFNNGVGGEIREFGSNFPLLVSMLIQQDISPITIMSFAEQQYLTALSSIDHFIMTNLADYIANISTISLTSIDPNSIEIQALEKYYEIQRSKDVNLSEVFKDSTALVVNWPATLPMLGLTAAVIPKIDFDFELNDYMIRHHDNHVSPIMSNNYDFDANIVKTLVLRSDGNETSGVFYETLPLSFRPYARQLWMKASSYELFQFDVNYDTETTPLIGTINQFWYKRSTNTLSSWDIVTLSWIPASVSISSRWIAMNSAVIRNSLVLAIEQKLYDSVHQAQQINIDLLDVTNDNTGILYSEIELAEFAAKYKYDAYAPDYDPSNAFTWNYSQASFPGIPVGDVARWYSIYSKYFAQFTSFPTNRPELEPWKLGTLAIPASEYISTAWIAAYSSVITPGAIITTVRTIAQVPITTPLMGLYTFDGVILTNGDKVLLTAQLDPAQNGIYIASAGGWSRSSDVLTNLLTVKVLEGLTQINTLWVLTTSDPITASITPITFEQARPWSTQMWVDIQTASPLMKICVNPWTDTLLAPYTAPSEAASSFALLNVIPVGINLGYKFGDIGPTELAWMKSIEYTYGKCRSYFRLYPLKFLDKTWGETYISTGTNLRTERNLMTSLPSDKFLMHGEQLNILNNYTPTEVENRIIVQSGGELSGNLDGTLSFKVTHCADNVTVFTATLFGEKLINLMTGNYSIFKGETFTLIAPSGITVYNVQIVDKGIAYEIGDTLNVTFYKATTFTEFPPGTDFVYDLTLGCEGCVADATPDPSAIISIITYPPTFSHISATTKIFKGLGQWFTNLLRFSYIDTDVSNSSIAYRHWDVKLSHRLTALIRPESLTINTNQGKVPDTGYNVIIKRSSDIQSLWISALRIQLVQIGSKKLNASGLFIPATDASDWIFRIEVFNPNHPQITYNTLDTNSDFTDFHVLNKEHCSLTWNRYTTLTGTSTITMPLQVTGLQNVLNYVYGYVDYLESVGFKINANDIPVTDPVTGRNLDWQLEVEKFIDTVYAGMNAGSGYILNPFIDKLYLQTPYGLMSRYTDAKFLDPYSSQACYDYTGSTIPIEKLSVIRTDEQAITYSSVPIYSAHIFIDEYEHAIIFNNQFSTDSTSPKVFIPFLGEYINSAFLTFTRQAVISGKPTFDGFFLNGDNVSRNISSNIDALKDVYDADKTFNEQSMASHATALLGFKTQSYFDDIDINSTTQLNFWRGMISAKGTNLAVDAFTQYKSFLNSSIDEFWAYKVGVYGDARERTFPEIKIQPNDVSRKFLSLQFYINSDTEYDPLPLYTQIEANNDTRWFSINDLGTNLRFDALAISETVSSTLASVYIKLTNIYHTGDTFGPIITGPINGAQMVSANILHITIPGEYTVSGYSWSNQTKLSPVKLFDYKTNTLDSQVGLWHPAIGVHAYSPLEIINIQGSIDPANYNYTLQTVNNPNYMALKPWDDKEVGRVWWDTENLAYIPYYDAFIFPDREARQTRWGALAEYASIDLYQWTESNYHPSAYNAQSLLQEGDSSIDASVRLSGVVGFSTNYKSERTVYIRPIAWSQTSSSNGLAHPSFGPATFTAIYVSGNRIIMDTGRTTDANITTGYNVGAWDTINNKPLSEVQIGTAISYDIGSSLLPGLPNISPVTIASGNISNITVSNIDNSSIYGTRIGQIQLLNKDDGLGSNWLRMIDSTGRYQDVLVEDWISTNLSVDSLKIFTFDEFGIQINATRNTLGIINASDLTITLTNPLNDIFIRETVDFTEIVTMPSDSMYSNDSSNPTNYGWKVWQVPSQLQLTADLISPYNKWLPYLGDTQTVAITTDIVTSMKDTSNAWVLPNGITVNRFTSTWSNWTALNSIKQEMISNGILPITFILANETSIDLNRLSVYVNGIQLTPNLQYVIQGNSVQILNILSEGMTANLLYRPYQPSSTELAFDPSITENFTVQTKYKLDYEYTQIVTRNNAGNISGTKYYFWVKNKSIAQNNKSMSLNQAKAILENGESTYMIFSRLLADVKSKSGVSYDSCAISGLNEYVSDTDRYKLRFLRDFTLRDDPLELQLKNIHTEWELLRPHQSTKIPSTLWKALTNAVCGSNIAGNSLPFQVRINYDEKYNTNTRYGFSDGQIFCESSFAIDSIINTVLNTSLIINIGGKTISDFITSLGINSSSTALSIKNQWFSTPEVSRNTMAMIYSAARAAQVNEIFFNVLNDALASNYEFTDLFKTSLITVNSSTVVAQQTSLEQADEFY